MLLPHFIHDSLLPRALMLSGASLGISLGAVYLYKRASGSSINFEQPDDTVILHQPPRGPFAPSLVPFALKLETYLRMAKIPYKVEGSFKKSPKGKFPWIEYNKEVVSDSSFIIDFLNRKLDVNMNHTLDSTDLAIAKAMERLVQEHLYWCSVSFPWVLEQEKNQVPKSYNINKLFTWLIGRNMKKRTMVQGIGRHTKEEIQKLMEDDFKALYDILGSKPYFFGDEPTEVDCLIFGQLAQFRWNMPGSTPERVLNQKFDTLGVYCDRMRETFWPDWNDCITHGGTQVAVK